MTGIVVLILGSLLVLQASAADATDYAKVYVIPLTVRETGAEPGTVILMYGHGPELGLQSGTFRGELTDTQGKAIKTFPIWNPRIRFGDSAYVKPDGTVSKVSGVLENAERAEVTLVVPFSVDYAYFNFYDDRGTKVTSVDLSPVMKKFCAATPNDPDCGSTRPAPLSPLSLIGGIALLLIATGAGFLSNKKA